MLRRKQRPNFLQDLQKSWIEKSIDNHLSGGKFGGAYSGFFSPSYVGKPDRELFLDYSGLRSEPIAPELRRILENGSSMHDRYAKYFRDMGILQSVEANVTWNSPPIRGRLDIVIITLDNSLCLVEMKSKNNNLFSKMQIPDWGHIVQWGIYAKLSQIYDGCILYENKDNQRLRIFQMLLTSSGDLRIFENNNTVFSAEKFIETIFDNMLYVKKCYDTNKIPERCEKCFSKCLSISICENLEKGKEILIKE